MLNKQKKKIPSPKIPVSVCAGNPCSGDCGCTKATPENFLRAFWLTWCHFFLLFPARPACSVPRHKQCFLDFVTVRRTSPPACYHSLSTQELSNLKIPGQGEKSLVPFLSVNAASHIPRNPCCVPRNDFVHVCSQHALRSEGPMRTGIPIPTRRSSRQSSGVRNAPLSSDALLHAISSPLEAMTL